MFNRMYLIGSVWEKPKVFESSSRYAISFLLAVFAKQTQCGQPPHEIGEWFQVIVEDELGRCCKRNLQNGNVVYVEGKVKTASILIEQNDCPTTIDSRCYVCADSVVILSKTS
jgi:single-stranded DNA-binding protein